MLNKNKQKNFSSTFNCTSVLHRAIALLFVGYTCYFLVTEQRHLSHILSYSVSSQLQSNSIPIGPNNTKSNPVTQSSLANAINTLRCFIASKCYPRLLCASGKKPRKIQLPKHWEEQSFCIDDLFLPKVNPAIGITANAASNPSKPLKPPEPCLVYSFGINDNIEWETKMAKLFNCQVFAFDPTSKFEMNPAPNVTFYKLGLQGARVDEYSNSNGEYVADVAATHSEMYEAINSTLLRTLEEIQQIVGHEGRTIDVLKMDCEGCEYGVLKQLACRGGSQNINQLMVEFHFSKNLGFANPDDVLLAADAIQCLERERWGIVTMEASGIDALDAQYIEPMLKVVKALYMAVLITLRRAPASEKMPWDVLNDAQEVRAKKNVFERKYGRDHNVWPKEVMDEFKEVDKEWVHNQKFDAFYPDKKSGFEVNERFPE